MCVCVVENYLGNETELREKNYPAKWSGLNLNVDLHVATLYNFEQQVKRTVQFFYISVKHHRGVYFERSCTSFKCAEITLLHADMLSHRSIPFLITLLTVVNIVTAMQYVR